MSDLEKALLALVAGMVGVLIWVIKQRRNGHGKSAEIAAPTAAQLSLVQGIVEHLDAMERRLHERLDRMQSDLLMAAREVALALKDTQSKGRR